MRDIVLVTADSIRYDFVEAMDFVSSLSVRPARTVAHYTRPSLAGLLSSQYQAAVKSAVVGPTVPEVLSERGYTCLGVAPSPQLDEVFDFDRGFDEYENFADAGSRESKYREFLAQFDLLRKIYHRFFPPHAKMSDLPTDEAVVDLAVEQFNAAASPRFLWVHLMGSHRPYGRGDDAVPKALDRKALFSASSLSQTEQDTIETNYRNALSRVDSTVERLYTELDGEVTLLFTSDHGDEFGEEGYYFHQPQRMRTAEALTTVPVGSTGIDFPDGQMSLLDLGPLVADVAGVKPAEAWDGIDIREENRSHTITIAPWHDSASVRFSDAERTIVSRNGRVSLLEDGRESTVERDDRTEEVEDRLRDLGYVE